MSAHRGPPLVAHVVHALRTGGLENGVVNLINATPPGRYRHAVVCMTDHDGFARRIRGNDVPVIDLGKRPGKDPAAYARLWRLLRRLRPDIVHTRNMATLEAQVPAWLAGVRGRVHGEHGRDMLDLTGDNPRYRLLRRVLRPLVSHYIALSGDLHAYLEELIGVPAARISRICNGVDTDRFQPSADAGAALRRARGWPEESVVLGWVGRMEAVKNPLGLVEAVRLLDTGWPALSTRVRLVLVGGGSEAGAVEAAIDQAGLAERVWLAGPRDDVAALLPAFDAFVLPSLAEGISNTILEAMACGVAVIATDVGGNAELVQVPETGTIVASADPSALARALAEAVSAPVRLRVQGEAARRRAEAKFSIDTMVAAYLGVYDAVLARREPVAPEAARRSESA